MLIAAMATVEEVEWLSTPVSYSAYITTYFWQLTVAYKCMLFTVPFSNHCQFEFWGLIAAKIYPFAENLHEVFEKVQILNTIQQYLNTI